MPSSPDGLHIRAPRARDAVERRNEEPAVHAPAERTAA